jgi:hypothetical protein
MPAQSVTVVQPKNLAPRARLLGIGILRSVGLRSMLDLLDFVRKTPE